MPSVLAHVGEYRSVSANGQGLQAFMPTRDALEDWLGAEPADGAVQPGASRAGRAGERSRSASAQRVDSVLCTTQPRLQEARIESCGRAGQLHRVRARVGEQGAAQAALDRIEALPR